jgi:ppGpp synthetase/RelA/SpoT-type nucleotidyltranferase
MNSEHFDIEETLIEEEISPELLAEIMAEIEEANELMTSVDETMTGLDKEIQRFEELHAACQAWSGIAEQLIY